MAGACGAMPMHRQVHEAANEIGHAPMAFSSMMIRSFAVSSPVWLPIMTERNAVLGASIAPSTARSAGFRVQP
jgi:hypothetical protein